MLWFLLSCVRTFQVGDAPVDTALDSPVDDTAADDTGELPTVCVPGTSSAWRLPSPRCVGGQAECMNIVFPANFRGTHI